MKTRILICLFALVATLHAMGAPRPQVFWCEGNTTLSFLYDEPYEEGATYNGQTVTSVWSGDDIVFNLSGEVPG